MKLNASQTITFVILLRKAMVDLQISDLAGLVKNLSEFGATIPKSTLHHWLSGLVTNIPLRRAKHVVTAFEAFAMDWNLEDYELEAVRDLRRLVGGSSTLAILRPNHLTSTSKSA
jgi:hypothetical protein